LRKKNMEWDLTEFVRESNKIENINRDPLASEINAHHALLEKARYLTVQDICDFVDVVQPGAKLRTLPHMNVRVGNHIPPRGGEHVRFILEGILLKVNKRDGTPHAVHLDYEKLHPFMDGNGRSGRAIWLYMMFKENRMREALGFGFLRAFYYQTLAEHESKTGYEK